MVFISKTATGSSVLAACTVALMPRLERAPRIMPQGKKRCCFVPVRQAAMLAPLLVLEGERGIWV